jgi:hypothetical protein
MAPPLMIEPDSPIQKKPIGGVSVLPFLSSITDGQFKLRKTDQNQYDKSTTKNKKSGLPGISLDEILKIRQNLKKSSD